MKKGGHIRTGNEDAAGNTEFTNAECTKAIVDLTKSVGRPVAYGNDAIPRRPGQHRHLAHPLQQEQSTIQMMAQKDPTGACA